MIDTAELHRAIAERAEDFVRALFDDRAKRVGKGWRIGKRGSLAVDIRDGTLLAHDHETGDKGGDCVWLWQRERGGTDGEALRACAAWAGLTDDAPSETPRREVKREKKPEAPRVIPPLPQAVADAWREGREWLLGNADAIRDVGAWRTWPWEYVTTLGRAGVISAPRYYSERARIAFPVATPETWPLGAEFPATYQHRDRGRFVGFHARLSDRDGERRGWRYIPRRDDKLPDVIAHPGLPLLPLVLSGAGAFGSIWAAKLLIICEGEFDAATVPLALSWYDVELGLLRIPPAVAIVGIAGAGGSPRELLDSYGFAWPHGGAALVLRDSDDAGTRWTAPGGFLDKLRARCARVASCHFGSNPDGSRRDVNDAFAAGALTRELLDAILTARLGMTLADAERNTPPPA